MYISSAQMYQEMRSLHDAVTRMDTKLDGLAGQTATISDHETRIRSLEQRRWPLQTVSVVAGAIGAGTGLFALLGR
ncbi:hypothetical protein ACFWWT_04055 [Streptomyces sp. NPDC058676]|uniref:hypothetical protein n=1 Tax=Streptomyces sp. NPDC058676 TaxID=3346593 RepID=UPI00365F6AD0